MRPVYIISGCRTPYLPKYADTKSITAADLAVTCSKHILLQYPWLKNNLCALITGGTKVLDTIAIRLGIRQPVNEYSIQHPCAADLQAIMCAWQDIMLGQKHLVLAGGTTADNISDEASIITNYNYAITTEQMDAFVLRSHKLAALGVAKQQFTEIVPLFTAQGKYYKSDAKIKINLSHEELSQSAAHRFPFNPTTKAHIAEQAMGAGMLLLASSYAVEQYNLQPIACIKDIIWTGASLKDINSAPAHAITSLLNKQQLELTDIDCWEMHEASSGQILSCLQLLQATDIQNKFNLHGGSLAIGHVMSATGIRLVLRLLQLLQQNSWQRGVASIGAPNGQAGAILLESIAQDQNSW